MTEVYRFLHLADVHIGQDIHNIVLHKDIRNEVINDAKQVYKSIGPADSIFIAGDIAFSGKKEQYDEAELWLKKLTDAVGCPEHAVYLVPGNHDVDRDRCSPLAEELQDSWTNKNQDEISKTISLLINEPSEMLIQKFDNFRNFTNGFKGYFISPKEPCWKISIEKWTDDSIRVLGLNSALFSHKKNEMKRIALGEHQFIFEREPGIHNVILMHHPLEWLADEERIREYLESRARIWLFGHEHEFRIDHKKAIDGFERVEIYAGATNPPRAEEVDFRYNWIEISVETLSRIKYLKIVIWPRVWTSSTKFVPDTNGLQGAERKEILINVEENNQLSTLMDVAAIQDQANPESVDKTRAEEDSEEQIDSLDILNSTKEIGATEGHIVSEEDHRFARLQYLFWKKIQRDERLQILIDLNILPDIENEVIQTWIRHGLNMARNRKRLHELWEKVMAYLPHEEHEENPFPMKEV